MSPHAANTVAPFANGDAEVFGLRRNTWLTSHSPRRDCSIATSSIWAVPLPSRSVTLRPRISAMMRTSPPRCSKRRRLMSPVVMIWPEPMLVTRPIDRNTLRLPGTSTIMPTTLGTARAR